MTVSVQIIDATAAHARALGRVLRQSDRAEIMAYGVVPEDGAYVSFRNSLLRRTAVVNGLVAAMWGVVGTPLGRVGTPWLLTGYPCLQVSPVRFFKIYRREAQDMLRLFPVLENHVDFRYTAAMRMLRLAGFQLDAPMPFGVDGDLFCRFEARAYV